jgi:transcriptional regulator with XRE-family HTH domain
MTAQTMREQRKAQGITLGEEAKRRGITVTELNRLEFAEIQHKLETEKGTIFDGMGRPIWNNELPKQEPFKEVLGFKVHPVQENGEQLCSGEIKFVKGGIDKVAENMLKAANPDLPGLTYKQGVVRIPIKTTVKNDSVREKITRQRHKLRQSAKRHERRRAKFAARLATITEFWNKQMAHETAEIARINAERDALA